MSELHPLAHYEYPKVDIECTCNLCENWRLWRNQYDKYKVLTSDHIRSCFCWRCCRRREAQQHFLAMASQRELYCEMSYHAAQHAKTYGPHLMVWMSHELKNNEASVGWWATIAQTRTLVYWFMRFQASSFCPSGLASGVI